MNLISNCLLAILSCKVKICFNMFSSSMKYRISRKISGTHIITPQTWDLILWEA
jgi:hypothetical protein